MKKFILAIFASVLIFLPTSVGSCYVTLSYKDVPLSFAKLRLPSEMYVVEVDYASLINKLEKDDFFIKTLENEKDEAKKTKYLQALKYLFSDEAKKTMQTIKLYQVGLFANNSYNTAFIVSVKNNKDFTEFNKVCFASNSLEENEKNMNSLKNFFKNVYTESINKTDPVSLYMKLEGVLPPFSFGFISPKDKTTKDEVVFFDLGDFNYKQLKNNQMYSTQMRFAGNLNDTLFSLYAKLYCVNNKKSADALLLMTLDNERELWSKIFDDAILGK